MTASYRAFHVASQTGSVLTGETDAAETVPHDRIHLRELTRAVHRISAAGVALVSPGHRRDVSGAQRPSLRIDAVQLSERPCPPLRFRERSRTPCRVTGDELGEQSVHCGVRIGR